MKLNISEIARCLDLPVGTLERWVRQGRIPVQKSGANGSFDTEQLKKWAASRNLPFSLPKTGSTVGPANNAPENLLSVMERGGLHMGITGTDVAGVLTSAAACVPGLTAAGKVELYTTLMEREELTSTGMGNGVAVPHPRTPLSAALDKPMIVTCFPAAPIDFSAIDSQPVFVLFLLLSTSVRIHLHLLSRLAFCIRDNDFVSFLKSAPSAHQFFLEITKFENKLEKSDFI